MPYFYSNLTHGQEPSILCESKRFDKKETAQIIEQAQGCICNQLIADARKHIRL